MTSPSSRTDGALRRHDLVVVSRAAWQSLLAERRDLAGEPLVAGWVDRGWPLIVRRPTPGEGDGLPLGLPLPPSHGKRRLALLLPFAAMVSTAPPPLLSLAIDVAPAAWRPSLRRLVALAASHGGTARVYGSLAWHLTTRLDYLTPRSDLDLLLEVPRTCDGARLTVELAAVEAAAPMRLDGELVRDDGAAVNWREIHEGAREVLVKTTGEAILLPVSRFLGAEMRP